MVAVAVGKEKFAPHLKDFVALSIEGASVQLVDVCVCGRSGLFGVLLRV